MVEDYIATMKRIKERNLKERQGDMYRRDEMERHWEPIVQSNEKMMKEITKDLKPIKMEVENLNRNIKEEEEEPPRKIRRFTNPDGYGPLARQFKNNVLSKDPDVDTTYGIHFLDDGKTAMGNKYVIIDMDDIILGDEVYHGTPGLWTLITAVKKNQIEAVFITPDDLDAYKKLLKHTNTLYRNFDPTNAYPRSTATWKWKNILKAIWEDWKRDESDDDGNSGYDTPANGNGLFIQKKDKCYRADPIEGDGLLLTPHKRLFGNGNGLFLKRGSNVYDGEGLLLGQNSPFKNIPILGWIL